MREIEQLQQEQQRVLAAQLHSRPPDGLPHSRGRISDPTGEAASHWADLDAQIAHKLQEANRLRQWIEAALVELEAIERLVVRFKYIERYPWWKVGCEAGYSETQVRRIHQEALAKMDSYGQVKYGKIVL